MNQPLTPILFPGKAQALDPVERPLRIVIVSQYFPPEIGATQARMQAFAEFFAVRGHRVTVICELPNHPRGIISEEYRGYVFKDDRSNLYRILRVWVKASPDKTKTTRLAFYVSYMLLAAAVSPLAGGADVVLATTPPLFAGVAGTAIARLKGAQFVLDVRDLWPTAAVGLNEIASRRALRMAEALERRLYRDAATVVAVTRPFCQHIDKIRQRNPQAVLIPNGTLEHFFTHDDGWGRERLRVPANRFVVTFAGTHGIAQGLPAAVEAAARADRRVHFAFVGEGPVKESLVASAEGYGLENVTFHPERPLEEIPSLLAASDALLVPLSSHPSFTGFVPSKLFDFMAAGRPIILSARGEGARIVERAGAGIVVEPENPSQLARAAEWLAVHPSEADEMGKRGREFARGHLRHVQAERLEHVLLDVARGRA